MYFNLSRVVWNAKNLKGMYAGMEEVMARSRYARHSVQGRRRKKAVREKGGLPRLITKQILIALVLLLVAVAAKSLNTPATNFVSEKIRFVLVQNIELKSIYDYLDKTVVNLKNSIAPASNNAVRSGEDGAAGGTDTGDKAAPKDGGKSPADSVKTPAESGNSPAADTLSNGYAPSQPETSVLSASFVSESEAPAGMQTPVSGILSSPWGERKDPLTGVVKFHEGIDIEANKGAAIEAAMKGTVEEAGSSPTYGNYVKLGHAGGLETIYAHCSTVNAKKGEAVTQGETIARVGDTGASVGSHLHFEVLKDGKPVNPLDYISLDSQ